MGCFLACEGEISGILDGVGVRNTHFANASSGLVLAFEKKIMVKIN